MKLLGFIGLFMLVIQTAFGQGFVAGKVLDESDKNPLSEVGVFVNGTANYQLTDADGGFKLKISTGFPILLVFQMHGYKTQTLKIEKGGELSGSILLKRTPKELQAITIKASNKKDWEEFGPIFLDNFLSYSEFSKNCKILNKERIVFAYDSNQLVLNVFATEPIFVENRSLGYQVSFDLQDFRYEYRTPQVYFSGYSRFVELKPKNRKQELLWAKNRQSAYYGSLQHFMRTVFQNNLTHSGFRLYRVVRAPAGDYGRMFPQKTILFPNKLNRQNIDTLVIGKQTGDQRQILLEDESYPIVRQTILNWNADEKDSNLLFLHFSEAQSKFLGYDSLTLKKQKDSLKVCYFRTDALPPSVEQKLDETVSMVRLHGNPDEASTKQYFKNKAKSKDFDFLYPDSLTLKDFRLKKGGQIYFYFPDYLDVVYEKETEEEPYWNRTSPGKRGNVAAPQSSLIHLRQNDPLLISPSGNFFDPYKLMIEGYWSYERLDKMLPLEYVSDPVGKKK